MLMDTCDNTLTSRFSEDHSDKHAGSVDCESQPQKPWVLFVFYLRQSFALPKLALNSWAQAILLLQPPQ
jgi:hypothetical protein